MKNRRSSRPLTIVTALVVAAVSIAAPAVAAGPEIERIAVDHEDVDPFLSDACGVEVTTRAEGMVIIRTFEEKGRRPLEVVTLNVAFTASADGNTVRFRDVGADRIRQQRDGTLVMSLSGQSPFDFKGVLKVDLDTGEVLHEPRRSAVDDLDELCATLTA